QSRLLRVGDPQRLIPILNVETIDPALGPVVTGTDTTDKALTTGRSDVGVDAADNHLAGRDGVETVENLQAIVGIDGGILTGDVRGEIRIAGLGGSPGCG